MKTYNIEKDFLMRQRDLLLKIGELKTSYSKEEIDYLTSIIMLDESVLKANCFSEMFNDANLMFEIAKYNICKRAINTIEKLDIDQSKVITSSGYGALAISYCEDDNKDFDVFYADLVTRDPWNGSKIRPHIILKEISTSGDEILNEEAKVSNLITKSFLSDWNINFGSKVSEKGQKQLVKSLSWIDIYKSNN